MAVIQVAYDVPAEIAQGLLDGSLSRFGSVVRNDKQIIRHLKEVKLPEAKPERLSVAEVLANNKGAVIGTLIVVGGLVITAVAIAHNKKKAQSETPACVTNFKAALAAYSKAMRSGTMEYKIIDALISALDELKENESKQNITIDFSSNEFAALVDMIMDYTKQLATANSFEMNNLDESGEDTIINLRKYLQVQKHIFEQAS